MIVRAEGKFLTEAQLQALIEYAIELENVVRDFKVSNIPIPLEDAELIAKDNPNRIFSLEADWTVPVNSEVTRMGFALVPGFWEDCEDFFSAEEPFLEPPSPTPYTEIRVRCAMCVGQNSAECENCDEGDIIFDLKWDGNGEVTASVS